MRSWNTTAVRGGGVRRRAWILTGLVCLFVLLSTRCQGQTLRAAIPAPTPTEVQVANQIPSQPQPEGPSPAMTDGLGNTPALSAQSDTAQIGSPMPKIMLDKTTYDFNDIRPNTGHTAVFHLSNAGGSTLEITEVKKCCGAVVKLDKPRLEPGETATLTAEYRASQVAGLMTKKIGLVTNDPNQPRVELTIAGRVVQTLTWTPTRFDLAIRKDDVKCPEITIKSLDGEPFSIKTLVSTGQCLTADFDPTAKAMEFVLKPKVDTAKLEALSSPTGMVRIELSRADYPAIDLGFAVIPALQAIPSQILVFGARAGESVVRSIHEKKGQPLR